jgi:hypothetical protein
VGEFSTNTWTRRVVLKYKNRNAMDNVGQNQKPYSVYHTHWTKRRETQIGSHNSHCHDGMSKCKLSWQKAFLA